MKGLFSSWHNVPERRSKAVSGTAWAGFKGAPAIFLRLSTVTNLFAILPIFVTKVRLSMDSVSSVLYSRIG
jgi:hypothetical protein